MEPGNNELSVIFKPVEQDFFRLLRFIHGVDTNKVPLTPRAHRTYFLALTFNDLNNVIPHIEDISIGLDLWGIRADLLASYDLNYLSFQIATLRRHSSLPILFIIRTKSQKSQIGRYPDTDPDNNPLLESLASYLRHALRLGVEYVELELDYPRSVIESIIPIKGNTSIIGAFFDWKDKYSWDSPEVQQIYDKIVDIGADVATMILQAKTFEDNMKLRTFASSVENGPIPLSSINMGIEGKISRALNHYISPVSHPLVPPTTSGHLTFQECQSILYFTGLLPQKKYYVFGHPIPHSMSPVLHNTAFTTLGLPHVYSKVDTASIDEVRKVMESSDFGGASVTLPHARSIIPLLQHLSRHAQIIGAVNTVSTVSWGGHGLLGDNTDWRGIKNCLLRSLTPAHTVTSSTTALVLGAGGSARASVYALYRIGVINIFVYNRTGGKAQSLVDDFQRLDHLLRIKVLDSMSVPLPINPPPTIIVSTVPAFAGSFDSAATEAVDVGLKLDHLSMNGGVAVELAYETRLTSLLALAEQRRMQGSQWVGVEGIEVLLQQGCEQCKMWTGRRAPVKQVRAKVLEVYDEMLRKSRQ
ncbi:shikimate-5-dehydrogenase [Macrolepiota fuliginosa MF-IS2]|uniref:Shikimate-5-dehydrogenase n=1 Tax=Macrolepiota fuliginosa MF-IS2 TaxID=1400762 RepID=A0A9P5XNB4_9AGAR|nr:shikimate-5-dehydrogenase [Macrolepiota fuliginosa MF-IS2]